jgi:hypothetical protein
MTALMRPLPTHGLVLALLAGLGCTRPAPRAVAPDPSPIIFSHKKHVEEAGASCVDCHGTIAAEKELPRHPDFPRKAKCAECHDVKARDQCEKCHRDGRKPTTYAWSPPAGRLRFAHQTHVGRTKDCVVCHGAVAGNTGSRALVRPKHRECLSCHQHQVDYARLRCDGCHTSLRQFPLEAVSRFSHEGNFLHEHRGLAKANASACAQCHMERFCDDCHSRHNELLPSVRYPEKVERQLIHRGDWRTRHPLEVSAKPGSCLRCHSQKQCLDCHRVEGIGQTTPSGRGENSPAARPHGPSWMNPTAPDFHGRSARRNVTACAGCHDRGPSSNCVSCHRPGGAGGNPHPGGRPRGREGEKSSNRMCRICHG